MSAKGVKTQILGEQLEDQCTTKQQVLATSITSQASNVKLPDWRVLQMCNTNDITVTPVDTRYDLLQPPSSIRKVNITSQDSPYILKERLGEGGYGRVYLAIDKATGEQVAIKEHRVYQEGLEEELDRTWIEKSNIDYNEIDLLYRWNHPHVMHAKDILLDHEDRILMVLPYALELSSFLESNTVPLDVRVRWIEELVDGMAFIQSQGHFHCDIKPENCFLLPIEKSCTNTTDPHHLKLVVGDLGLSYPYEYRKTDTCGTSHFNPLEMDTYIWNDLADPTDQLIQALDTITYKPQISKVDMYLVGNTALYILSDNNIFGSYSYMKSNPSATTNRILRYIQGEDDVLNLHGGFFQLDEFVKEYPKVASTVRSMLALDPSKRPDTFIDVLVSMDGKITPGSCCEVLPTQSLSDASESDLRVLSKCAKKIIMSLQDIGNYNKTVIQYELLFNVITLLYRAMPMRLLDQSKTEEILQAVLCLAFRLGWIDNVEHLLQLTTLLEVDDMDRIYDVANQITVYLKGTLRFPFLYQVGGTDAHFKDIVKSSVTNPSYFIKLMLQPYHSYTIAKNDIPLDKVSRLHDKIIFQK